VEAAAARLGGEVLPEAAAQRFWEEVREQRLPVWNLHEGEVLWRLALPPTTPAWADAEDALVEWGGGLRWLRRPAADDSWFERARAVGGHAMRWRGARTGERVFAPRGAAERAIEARLKVAFDPDGVFARRLPLE
jgi:glycolate oxidase FAD binding subunit